MSKRLPVPHDYGPANYKHIFPRGSVPGRRPPDSHGQSTMPTGDFVAMLRRLGVEKGVVRAATNEATAALVREFPNQFIGIAEVSPYDGMRGVRELERLVREQGLSILSVDGLSDIIPANDRRYYPLYTKAAELDIPVRVYCGMNYANDRPYDIGHPRHLDQVAIDFPELRISAALCGWPWINEMVGLLRRHPNLYCDTAAHRPRHFATPGSGWEMFMQFGNTLLQDKVMVGLSWTMFGESYETLLNEYLDLPLKDSVKDKWLFGNAARFVGLA